MMGTCDTCKHWEDRGAAGAWFATNVNRLRSCNAPLIKYGYGIDESEVSDNGALVEYDVGFGILTGPKFGCVLHELPKVG